MPYIHATTFICNELTWVQYWLIFYSLIKLTKWSNFHNHITVSANTLGESCQRWGGTVFGGRREPILSWHKAYYAVFQRSVSSFFSIKIAFLRNITEQVNTKATWLSSFFRTPCLSNCTNLCQLPPSPPALALRATRVAHTLMNPFQLCTWNYRCKGENRSLLVFLYIHI
jgi:hypothetical protein